MFPLLIHVVERYPASMLAVKADVLLPAPMKNSLHSSSFNRQLGNVQSAVVSDAVCAEPSRARGSRRQ